MNFDIAVDGRPWKIAIEAAEGPGRFTVVVKGKKRVVDASWIDADTLSLIDGSLAREVRFHPRDGAALGVAFDGRMFEAVVSLDRRRQPRAGDAGSRAMGRDRTPADGRHAVRSPMPGRIVRVLVAPGDRVVARAACGRRRSDEDGKRVARAGDGVVKEMNVQEGAAIDTGAVLVVIE